MVHEVHGFDLARSATGRPRPGACDPVGAGEGKPWGLEPGDASLAVAEGVQSGRRPAKPLFRLGKSILTLCPK